MAKMKPRQQNILHALQRLGGTATTRQVAEATQLHTNGVSQSLGALKEYVELTGEGKAGDTQWKLTKEAPGNLPLF